MFHMNPEKNNEIIARVRNINNKFAIYKEMDGDDIRSTICKIGQEILLSEDRKSAMDNYLEDVYAIVKATANLFSKGKIEVTATSLELKLAENVDFITIKDNKAIYKNSWIAGGEQITWKMIHYDEQLMGGILLHQGYAIEMATGEGKTLVATLPTVLNALTHEGVHIMTVNAYLSMRDYEITRPIYLFLGLTVGCLIKYNTHNINRKYEYASDIVFGTNSDFTFDYLYDHLTMTPEECVQEKHNFAIIDELDSVLIDDADEPHIVSGGEFYNVGSEYKKYKPFIEEMFALKDTSLYNIDKLHNRAEFTNEGKKWLRNKSGIADLYKYSKTYEIPDFKNMPLEQANKFTSTLNIQNIFNQFLNAYKLYQKDIHYVVSGGKIVIIDPHTGRLKRRSRWEHGLHTAIETKEDLSVMNDSNGIAVISLKNYFRLYNKFSGMSGTIQSVSQELKEVYGLESAVIPTHATMKRIDFPLKVYRNCEAKNMAIVQTIEKLHKDGRPVLVGSNSIKRSEQLSRFLEQQGIKHCNLNAKTEEKEAEIISQAGQTGSIILATSIAGRGTDIKISAESFKKGGLAIIGTDMFDSVRVDRQLKGRAGRQGDPGSSLFFASLDDFIIENLSDADKSELKKLTSEIEGNEVTCAAVISLVMKAQRNREFYFYLQRKETAQKDDIIAPYRKLFYEERNAVLRNPFVADSIINKILVDKPDATVVDNNMRKLFNQAKKITRKISENNQSLSKISIAFSDNQHLFIVKFDANMNSDSYDYFCREYKRQVILLAYDKYWKLFVQHLIQDLNRIEVDHLIQDFNDMQTQIGTIVYSRLLNATIPVGKDEETENEPSNTFGRNEPSINKKKSGIYPETPCPCGSGKKYGECHGKNIRPNCQKRRR